MISIGVDIVQISNFDKQLQDRASVFYEQVFSEREKAYAQKNISGNSTQHLAGHYAAKEAFIKSWSSLFKGKPPQISNPDFQEIELVHDRFGRPYIQLHGLLKEVVEITSVSVSISHDGDYSIASVIIEE
jgi:holo-[acyl-carrier protein] synthase